MLSIFRTNQLLAGILILGYAVLLHMVNFWQPLAPPVMEAGTANALIVPFLKAHPVWHFPMVIGLLFIQALLANGIIFANRIISPVNLFPGVFVVLIGSILPDFLGYSGFLFANIFLLLALRSYLKAFRASTVADLIFNTGFWLGAAALFVPTYLIFIIPFSIMLPILKSGKIRDQLILLFGMILPLYLLGIGYFWYDALPQYWEQQWIAGFSIPQYMDWTSVPLLSFGLMVVLFLIVIFSKGIYQYKTKMETQIKINIIYWLLLGSGFSALWNMPWQMQNWQAAVPILGILLSFNFTKMKPLLAETWHLVLLALLFLLHFAPVFNLSLF